MTRKWTLAILLLGLLSQADGQTQDAPSVTASTSVSYSAIDQLVTLMCEVRNIGTRKLNWIFVKHSTTIFHGETKLVDDTRYLYKHPSDSNLYFLLIANSQVGDQGVYKCEIDGTSAADTIELVLLGSPVPPDVDAPIEPLNRTGCCQQQDVSPACLPVCAPSGIDNDTTVDFTDTCIADLPKLIYCGADGRNHENCCARSGLPAKCLLFCSNDQQGMAQLTEDHDECVNYFTSIVSCYELGGAVLPTPPQSVSVLPVSRDGSFGLLVSWSPPMYNAFAVSGYKIHYKQYTDDKYRVVTVNAGVTQYQVTTQVNTLYSIYLVAISDHGSSQPTERVDIVSIDNSSPGQASDVLACCQSRKVSSKCQTTLCHPRLWTTFNVDEILDCYPALPDVFTCLAGERNNTGCCLSNNVPGECLGLCSGSPPAFDRSLTSCVLKLSTVEACIQKGLDTQPGAPQQLTLTYVDSHSAMVSWMAPNISTSNGTTFSPLYYVQLRRGGQQAPWSTVAQVSTTYVELDNLTETENYAVRVITQGEEAISLPSAVVSFTTYPDIPTTDRPTIAHNFSQCCLDSGMPGECAGGCQYLPNMTLYFAPIIQTCMFHIGTVLSCAADGRNHTECCKRSGVQPQCFEMCVLNRNGPLDQKFLACMQDTGKIIMCYEEGLVDLVRTPEEVMVTNLTSHTVTVEWKNPETGPSPDAYILHYTNLNNNVTKETQTPDLISILQDLQSGSKYVINVQSSYNDTVSPPSQNITVFTPVLDTERPFVESAPTTNRMLWTNRTHCCKSSGISDVCQPLCLNRPATNGTDCSAETHNILTCAADGKDHSLCCREEGLPDACLPFCSSHSASNFSVRLAGCLADANLEIITSCFLSYSGFLPSTPLLFTAIYYEGNVVNLTWSPPITCRGSVTTETCFYDVHFWLADTHDLSHYSTIQSVESPYGVEGLALNSRYTFTVTARNSKGSGSAAPWQTIDLSLMPDASIAQDPKVQVFEQGSTVRLVCDVFDYAGPLSYSWRLRGRELDDSTGRILTLTRLDKYAEGNYTCTASGRGFIASATSYVNVRFKPEFNYFRTDSVSPNTGGQAVLACWFRGHPFTSQRVSIWTKDGQPIRENSELSFSVTSRYHKGITAFRLKIANVVSSDYGTYQCNVSNQYGYAVAKTKLLDPRNYPPPIPLTPYIRRNISACCDRKGVIPLCKPLCTHENPPEAALADPETYGVCLLWFDEFLQCATDGADHSLCCEQEAVPGTCIPLCKAEFQTDDIFNAEELLQCVDETPTILGCLEKGYDQIPTAPRDLVASFQANKIKISWTVPRRNGLKVTSYNVYYNFTGNPKYQMETITNLHGMNYELQGADPGHVYHIWMTAERYKFGQSQPSNVVSISAFGTLPMPPAGVKVDSVQGTTVTIAWRRLPPQSAPAEAFVVYYKPVGSGPYLSRKTRFLELKLSGLKASTAYTAHVTSTSISGEGPPSQEITFSTGGSEAGQQKGGGGGGLEEAQIAGIILAIVTVIAVGSLVAFFLFRSRVARGKRADTVSFENPSYGNQQVHISSLPSDNPYDSVMQPQAGLDKDANFDYARLHETQAEGGGAKPASEVDYPNTQYAVAADPTAVNVTVDSNGSPALQMTGSDGKPESVL